MDTLIEGWGVDSFSLDSIVVVLIDHFVDGNRSGLSEFIETSN